MTTHSLVATSLVALLNRYIALDPNAQTRAAAFADRVISIDLSGLGLGLDLTADPRGRFHVVEQPVGESDCVIQGNPFDLLRSKQDAEGASQLFSGKVRVSGDTELAQSFGRLLTGLDIDWEEQLSRLTGDIIAHQAGRALRATHQYVTNATATTRLNLNEYLTEENRLLVSRIEVQNWYDDVDRLRDDVERLAARIGKLESRTNRKGAK